MLQPDGLVDELSFGWSLELTNSVVELCIKPIVIGRKIFLFANTPKGAQDSVIYYSLAEACKEIGIDRQCQDYCAHLVFAMKQAALFRDAGKQAEIAELTLASCKNSNPKLSV